MSIIPINRPLIGEEERRAVDEVLRSGNLTDASHEGGRFVREFESKCRSLLKVKHVVAVNSGTAALLASLIVLGVKPGDEVIVPSFTFVATANTVVACGAKPVFADIKPDYNIDPRSVEAKITKRTRAVIPVHLYGYPADMDEISELAENHSISVIEDAAESLGAEYHGRQTGSISDAGCFSLYATKVITSGEGGAVSTSDDELAERLRMVRNHGMVEGYDTRVLGYNLRMPEVLAAIASVQMDKLQRFIESRRRNVEFLNDVVRNLKGVTVTQVAPERTHVWYLYTLHLAKSRDRIQERLRERGVGAAVYWKTPVHRTPFYEGMGLAKLDLPLTEDAASHVLSIPVHPAMTEEERERVAKELREAIRQYI